MSRHLYLLRYNPTSAALGHGFHIFNYAFDVQTWHEHIHACNIIHHSHHFINLENKQRNTWIGTEYTYDIIQKSINTCARLWSTANLCEMGKCEYDRTDTANWTLPENSKLFINIDRLHDTMCDGDSWALTCRRKKIAHHRIPVEVEI